MIIGPLLFIGGFIAVVYESFQNNPEPIPGFIAMALGIGSILYNAQKRKELLEDDD